MSTCPPTQRVEKLTKSQRVATLIVAICIFFALVLALFLQPDGRGHGTHQQLGLPPCTFKFLLNIPCPACGMTTSWALAVRGDWQQSFSTNSGGFLLFLSAVWGVPLLAATSILGRLPWSGLRLLAPIWFASAFLASFLQWGLRLMSDS